MHNKIRVKVEKAPLSVRFYRWRVKRAFRILRKSIPRASYSRADRKRIGKDLSKSFLNEIKPLSRGGR